MEIINEVSTKMTGRHPIHQAADKFKKALFSESAL